MAQFQTTTKQVSNGVEILHVISYVCPAVQVIEVNPGRVLLGSPDNGEMGNGGFLDE